LKEKMMEKERNTKTMRLTAAQALVKFLSVQFSKRDERERRFIPGIFGHGNVAGLGQPLYEYGEVLPYYQPFNEQSMVHTASGFARANNRLQTMACAASIGPGSTNMITGAALATINRLPVLLFPADYYATRHQGPVLQQLEHSISADLSVNDCFRPASRFFDRTSRPEQLLTALPEAMRVLTDRRKPARLPFPFRRIFRLTPITIRRTSSRSESGILTGDCWRLGRFRKLWRC
jgi:3D-(3,5/4)-trihydroxycyclohexane-1,2-dione acylhydrolase (decyclizing)